MTRLYAVSALFVLSTAASSQITIGLAEMPASGDVIQRVQAAPNPMLDYATTGSEHAWQFTELSAIGDQSTGYQSVSSTNFVYAIAFADLPFNSNRANHAKQGLDIPLSNLLPLDNPFTFLYRSSSEYRTVGMGVEMSGIPIPVIYDQQDVIYQLPLAYGNTSTSQSAWHVDIPQVGSYAFSQTRTNVVDGWGSITTPGGIFDVIRVKTTLDATDDIMGMSINRPTVREYKWLAQGLRTPVLQINTTSLFGMEVVSEVWYYDEPRSIEVVQPLAATLCPGAEFTVHYTATGAFNAGGVLIPANQFRAQLSDQGGSFDNAVNIGSVQATTSGTITATIPANTVEGSGYRIRVVGTSPAFTGTDNGFDITIGGAATAAISAEGNTQVCAGSEVILTAVGGPGYQWQLDGEDIPMATEGTFAASQAGAYTVTVSNACGNATSNTIDVVVHDLPVVSVDGSDITICAGSTGTLNGLDESGLDGVVYQWLLNDAPIPGATALNVQVELAGQYTLQASDPATGCSFTTEGVMVAIDEVDAPTITVLGDPSFCAGGSVELSIEPVDGLAYQWWLDGEAIANADGPGIVVEASGSYHVTAGSTAGCQAESAAVEVEVHALPDTPEITLIGDDLTASGTGDFQWFLNGEPIEGATGNSWTPDVSGNYTVELTDANGCTVLSEVYSYIGTGVDATGTTSLRVWPNPTSGSFTLEVPTAGNPAYEVLDILGQPVRSGNLTGTRTVIDLEGEAPGIYIVRFPASPNRPIRVELSR